ncbi:hypothetical protein [Nostoc sp.]
MKLRGRACDRAPLGEYLAAIVQGSYTTMVMILRSTTDFQLKTKQS